MERLVGALWPAPLPLRRCVLPPPPLLPGLAPVRIAWCHGSLSIGGRGQDPLPLAQKGTPTFGPSEPLCPGVALARQSGGVPHDDQPTPRACERNVGAARVRQESAAPRFVGANAREDDHLLLPALERIYRVALDPRRKPAAEEARLGRVECDDADVGRRSTAREKAGHCGTHRPGLRHVGLRQPIRRLTRLVDGQEGDRRVGRGPRKGSWGESEG
mmetsp:Transcript_25574/g.82532  ORF Transcript_25574/g.82532 Transcript_25574/m.82532 type:complete len:216 (-) Transcript_25574:1032-1679(-)